MRMCATEHAPQGRFDLLHHGYGLAEIIERGAVFLVENRRVNRPHFEGTLSILSKNASRHGYHLVQHRPGFFEAPKRRRRREPAVRFTAPLSERQAVQGQYDQQNRRP